MFSQIDSQSLDKLIYELSKFSKRIEAEYPISVCKNVLRDHVRSSVIKKNIMDLESKLSKLMSEYKIINSLISRHEFFTKKIVNVASTLITIIVIILSIYILNYNYNILSLPPDLESVLNNPEMFTAIILLGVMSIIGIVGVVLLLWIIMYSKIDVKKLKARRNEIILLLNSTSKRLNILRDIYEKIERNLSSPRTLHTCLCYSQYIIVSNILKDLKIGIDMIYKCRDRDCTAKALNQIRASIDRLLSMKNVCDSVFTPEYKLSILINDGVATIIKEIVENKRMIGDADLNIVFKLANRVYSVDLKPVLKTALLKTTF